MSTRQDYSYQENQRAAQRRRAELSRRQLRLAGERAERAAAAHRQAAAALDQAQQQLDAQRHQARTAAAQAAGSRRALASLESDLAASRAELATAERELRGEIRRVTRLQSELAVEETRMAAAVHDAELGLSALADLGAATLESLGELSPAERERLQVRQGELEESIHQLGTEVRFLTQDATAAPAAMVTLLAMEANGYRLRDTLTQDGLVSYFEREGESHQIAVRVAEVERAGESAARWEMIAETFALSGEGCLYEIEDFETAVEDLELGTLVPGRRVYPKDDRGVRVATGLPRPPVTQWRRDGERRRRLARE